MTHEELSLKTNEELRSILDERKIEFKSRANKDELIELILSLKDEPTHELESEDKLDTPTHEDANELKYDEDESVDPQGYDYESMVASYEAEIAQLNTRIKMLEEAKSVQVEPQSHSIDDLNSTKRFLHEVRIAPLSGVQSRMRCSHSFTHKWEQYALTEAEKLKIADDPVLEIRLYDGESA